MIIILACLSLISMLSLSCFNSKSKHLSATSEDILTHKKTARTKIPITILVKYAFSINKFEEMVEEKFPDIDIIQIGNYTSDRGMVEYERRMSHDDLTDIVMTWPLDIGKDLWKDRLIDMSGMQFTANYHTYMLNRISDDGKLYYLPGPAQVRGIIYNKTLFREKNWQEPRNFEEFVALCQKIENSGMRSLQLGLANPEVLDTAFVGFSYGNGFNKPQDSHWLNQYNQGLGSISPQFSPALNTFQRLIDAGVLKKNDLQLSYADREKMMFTRQCAMIEDSMLIARLGKEIYGSTDDFAMMPFFNPDPSGSWARLYMVCYIGLNKHLAEPQNKEKYAAVKKLMEYISTPEGQYALAADTGAMYSSVNNVPLPSQPGLEPILPDLAQSRVAIFPELKNAQTALRQALAAMLKGELTKDQLITAVDSLNIPPHTPTRRKSLCEATENFTLIETGSLVADIMREKTGADIALFMDNGKDGQFNGKGISGKIYQGEQTIEDILRILPDLKTGDTGLLQTISISGADLVNTLEYSLPVNTTLSGWFYYFSGLKMKFDPFAPPGSRVHSLTDAQGKPIIPNKIYTVAIMEFTVNQIYIRQQQNYDLYIKDILVEAFKERGRISPTKDNRFIIMQ